MITNLWIKIRDDYPEIDENIISLRADWKNLEPAYSYLAMKRKEIPHELYVHYFRELLKMSTQNVPKELIIKMFEGVGWDDIMYEDELQKIKEFPEEIIIYRGASLGESEPRTSWSLSKAIAEEFAQGTGKVLKTQINKSDILLYLAHEDCEEEIIANVTNAYVVE